LISDLTLQDGVEVAIVAYVVFRILELIEGTRALNLIKGLGVLLLILLATRNFNFYTLNWVLQNTLPTGFLALVVIFQPELRRALEDIGRGSLISERVLPQNSVPTVIDEIIKTVDACSKKRIGALIVFEQDIGLQDFVDKGTQLNSPITNELLSTIFMPFTPLHDGAVIIRRERIMAAACFLPITQNPEIEKECGTRHRAAVGITEITDALALIVSEETGTISMAHGTKLTRHLTLDRVREILQRSYARSGERFLRPKTA